MDGSIIDHTHRVAELLANEFRGNPRGEVEVWATTAQQREAMVVSVYDATAIETRFPKRSGEPEVLSVVRKAIGGIWARERSHTILIEALRIVDDTRLTSTQSMLGTIEGRVTHWATARSWLAPFASFLIGFGRATGMAPEFTSGLRSLSPREFFRFSYELETTAREGYERILNLIDEIEASTSKTDVATLALKFGVTGRYEFAKTLAEECFHAAVFRQLDDWLRPDGETFEPIEGYEAVKQLRELALEILSLGSRTVRIAPTDRVNFRSLELSGEAPLVSDAGCGALFQEYGMPLPDVATLASA